MNKFETKYGFFSESGDEYVIKTYMTPKPWINVITNGDYGLTLSQCGGGFSWQTHSEFNRVTRWHQDLIQDNWGKFIYIKNNATGEYWSPTFIPVKKDLDKYECRNGFGYTKFISEYKGILVELTVFVPNNDNLEIWDLNIVNKTDADTDLSLYTYLEWCLGSSADHHREFHKTFIQTEFNEETNSIYATKRLWEIPLGDRGHWNINYEYWGFLSCNKKVTDYETDKENFIGMYGDLINPEAVKNNKLTKKTGNWIDPIGCLKVDVNLQAGKRDTVDFYLGLSKEKNDIPGILAKYQSAGLISSALEDVKQRWNSLLSTMVIDTPDEGLNIFVNKWVRYQAIAGRLWGRTAYYQQSGAFGFRDQLQDSMVFLPIDPSYTEKQIKLHARHQFEEGTVLHWWHPIAEVGLQTKMTDDLLWLPFLLIQYIKETGNFNFLLEEIEYYDNKDNKESLFEHSVRAIEKVLTRFSERGLPLIGAGDWNDGLSAVGLDMKGESVWMAEFLYYVLDNFIPLCNELKNNKLAEKLSVKKDELKEAFNKYAWDGEWFFRATKDNGEKIGSKENEEGKIYINAQTWSVISNIGEPEKNDAAIESAKRFLFKKNGALLLYPAYTKPDQYIGYLSRYAAGRRENGGVYTHASTWTIWALGLRKEAELMYDLSKRMSPVYNGLNPDEYSAEPYVTPGNIDGPDSPDYGKAGWTWYTGSAAWFQKVVVDWILGIRAEVEGLVIDPCIPKEWEGFKIQRKFRNTVYNIEVINKNKVNSGVLKIIVDGVEQSSNVVTPSGNDNTNVTVIMG